MIIRGSPTQLILSTPGISDYSAHLIDLFRRYIQDISKSHPYFKADEKAKDVLEKIVIYRNDKTILTDSELAGKNIIGIVLETKQLA